MHHLDARGICVMYVRMALWCLLLIGNDIYAGARIYKWVDATGQIHFSDRPETGATELGVGGLAPRLNNGKSAQQMPAKGTYSSLELVRPKDDQDFYTDKEDMLVEILVFIEPNLKPGNQIQFVLDGNLVPGVFNNTKPKLVVAVGTHKLYAQVVDADNVVQATSATVNFRVRQKIKTPAT